MLHIANGDSIAGTLVHSALPGEKMAFREDLTSGPTPAGLSTPEWNRRRADFLTAAYELIEGNSLKELIEQQAALESHSRHEETVLWFAHDLNCQIHLISLLSLFAHTGSEHKFSLICIGEFPGVEPFMCLGQLSSENLESLFGTRHRVTNAEFDLGSKAWSAYCSPDPSDIETVVHGDTNALPFLGDALRRHLARFPSRNNGLGVIENWALEQLAAGPHGFAPLFARFIRGYPAYGLGDSQFWHALRRMADCTEPLVEITGVPPNTNLESIAEGSDKIQITPVGLQVLKGNLDFVALNGIDLWLGGVHLKQGESDWRFDPEGGGLIHAEV